MLRVAASAVLLLVSTAANAQRSYPTRPVIMVVATSTGGGADITTRELANGLSSKLGRSFVVENRPGAGGATAAEYVARAPADGYTVMMGGNSTHSANPHLLKSLRYDPLRDFKPIARVATAGAVVVVSPKSGLHTIADLVREAKAAPERFNYGAPNPGAHLIGEHINRIAGIKMVRVPYRSTTQALTDVIAGNTTITVVDAAGALAAVSSGQLRALAISSAQRSSLLPDVPTLQEAGIANFDLTYWNGVFAPSAVSADVVTTLDHAIKELMSDPTVRARLVATGLDPAYLPHDRMDAFVRKELSRWGELIRQAGIEPN